MVLHNIDGIDRHDIHAVATTGDIRDIQAKAGKCTFRRPSINIVSIVNTLRHDPDLLSGSSTRASIALLNVPGTGHV